MPSRFLFQLKYDCRDIIWKCQVVELSNCLTKNLLLWQIRCLMIESYQAPEWGCFPGIRASQKSHSRSKYPGERLVKVSGEAPDLTSDARDPMHVHQREYHRVKNRKHLGRRWEANTTLILPQRRSLDAIWYDSFRFDRAGI